jgi:hypothetical protein
MSMSPVFFDTIRKILFRKGVGNGAGMRGYLRGRGIEDLVLERGRGEGNGDEGPGMRMRGWG